LIGVSGLIPRSISTGDIGFILGPRLNAAGRLDSALTALKLLISQDVQEAGYLALKLDDQNRDRQKLTLSIQTKAEAMLKDEVDEAMLLFAAHEEFNPGLVGLVASRLTERYYRPAIVGAIDDETTRASCRSIPEFHITNALDQCADLLEHHGGHAAAAGFTVRNENLPALISHLRAIAQEELAGMNLRPSLRADLELPLNALKPEILNYLDWLEPTGQENPHATFVSRHLRVTRSRKVGRDESHLKLTVTDGYITYDAIAFRLGFWHDQMPPEIDLLYTFEINEFRGRQTLQLNVKDIKASSG
jgi:single-stranded-DNA-specific exonuclease